MLEGFVPCSTWRAVCSPLMGESTIAQSTKPEISRQGRIEFIDAIRGIASLMVVVEHAVQTWLPGYFAWSNQWVSFGRVGIVAFFMVSGYVVGVTLTRQTVRVFAIRRFWRLYPIYWIATLFYVAVSLATGSFSQEVTLFVVVINLTMLQGFIGTYSVLGVAWTLGNEIVFYLQSMFAKRFNVLSLSVWLGIGWLAIFGAAAAANLILQTSVTALAPLMLFSASFGYAIFLRDSTGGRQWVIYAVCAFLVVPVFGMALNSHSAIGSMSFNLSYIGGVALFALFYALRQSTMPRVMLRLGAMSYALYLVHTAVILLLESVETTVLASVGIATVGSVALAWLAHIYIERPFVEVGRRLSKSKPDALIGAGVPPR
jgi:peptidoglycan/LPS O-acetylase OafA/YrhL